MVRGNHLNEGQTPQSLAVPIVLFRHYLITTVDTGGSRRQPRPLMKDPHQLWTEANGDLVVYRRLMIEHGLLVEVDKSNQPADHKFVGLTRSCVCSVCGGGYGASWHIGKSNG